MSQCYTFSGASAITVTGQEELLRLRDKKAFEKTPDDVNDLVQPANKRVAVQEPATKSDGVEQPLVVNHDTNRAAIPCRCHWRAETFGLDYIL